MTYSAYLLWCVVPPLLVVLWGFGGVLRPRLSGDRAAARHRLRDGDAVTNLLIAFGIALVEGFGTWRTA